MASYFVTCQPQPDGTHAVHERSRCPPRCFAEPTEYLGEFLDDQQAATVARARYARPVRCGWPEFTPPPHRVEECALIPLRP